MSAGAGSAGGGRGAASQEFELNLAPIIDCFTVLITFMLASASFLAIGILDAGVAAAGAQANPGTPPAVNLTLELKTDHSILIKLNGKANNTNTLNSKNQNWDYDGLTLQLAGLKTQWPGLTAVTLLAENQVEYRDVVKSMEITKKTLPAVLLGGF